MFGVGNGELHDKSEPAQKRGIDVLLEIGGEDRESAILFHPLQQVTQFDIGETVVGIFHIGALEEKSIGFLEEKDGAACLRGGEKAAKILFRLADELADHRREIDAVEIESKVVRENFRSHRLSRPARPREKRADAGTVGGYPFPEYFRAVAHLRCDLV